MEPACHRPLPCVSFMRFQGATPLPLMYARNTPLGLVHANNRAPFRGLSAKSR
jgi:hypothetical protein